MTGAEILRCHVDQEHFQLQSIALFCSLCSSFSSRAALRLVELLICISAWLTACFATDHDGKGHRNVHVGTVIFSCEWLGSASLEANEEFQSALTVPRSAMSEISGSRFRLILIQPAVYPNSHVSNLEAQNDRDVGTPGCIEELAVLFLSHCIMRVPCVYCQCFQLKSMLPMEDLYAATVLCTPGIPGSVFIIP